MTEWKNSHPELTELISRDKKATGKCLPLDKQVLIYTTEHLKQLSNSADKERGWICVRDCHLHKWNFTRPPFAWPGSQWAADRYLAADQGLETPDL